MTNVVDFKKRIETRRQGEGQVTFILCDCTPDGTPLQAIVLHDAAGVVITALGCSECENSVQVINGRIIAQE